MEFHYCVCFQGDGVSDCKKKKAKSNKGNSAKFKTFLLLLIRIFMSKNLGQKKPLKVNFLQEICLVG